MPSRLRNRAPSDRSAVKIWISGVAASRSSARDIQALVRRRLIRAVRRIRFENLTAMKARTGATQSVHRVKAGLSTSRVTVNTTAARALAKAENGPE